MSLGKEVTLKCHRLSVSFAQANGFLDIIQDLNLDLYKGKTVGLVGESGCGKSLTAQSILRLLPNHACYSPYSKVLLNQQDLLNIELRQMRDIRGQRISMVFQEPMMALNPVKTFYKQISDVIVAHQKISKRKVHQRVLQLMKDVELDLGVEKLNQYPHQWSGGQKQRFLIAMALANQPDVLLADEPTTALDVVLQKQILLLLKKLQDKYGLALLLISHDFNVVRALADHIVVMYAGLVIEQAPAKEFWSRPMHPYVHMLMNSIPSYEKRNHLLSVIPGTVPSFDEEPSGCRFHPRCSYATSRCQNQIPNWYKNTKNHAVRCHLYPRTHPIEIRHELEPHLNSLPFITAKTILELEHVTVRVQHQRGWFQAPLEQEILKDISFKLEKGKTLAVVGESGSGKTTLARVMMGLYPKSSGKLSIAPEHNIQIIFQDPGSAMNPRWRVHEILLEGNNLKEEQDLFWILDAVQLPKHTLKLYPHELSGGQRQRVAIARALLARPQILICDEPTSALDISVQAQILNLLKNIQSEFGLSYILITHDLDVVGYLADEVCVLLNGVMVEKGPIGNILHQPKHEYTKYLLAARTFFETNSIQPSKGE